MRDRPGRQELLAAHLVLLTRPELDGGQQGLPLVRPPQQDWLVLGVGGLNVGDLYHSTVGEISLKYNLHIDNVTEEV